MALNRKTFKKAAAAVADTNLPSGYFNTVLYTGNGSTQRIGGYINRGAVFNGSSSVIQASGLNQFFNNWNDASWSAWINTTDTSAQYIACESTDSQNYKLIGSISSNKFQIVVRRSGTVYSGTSTTTMNDGNWHHIVATYESSTGTVKGYIDENEEISFSTGGTSSATFSVYDFCIGANKQGSNVYNPLDGKLDQVRIFDRALSSGEVTTLYGETHASTTIATTDIFNDDSGVALYQLDGNANDTGGASGKFGSAAIFNGSSSYITINSTSTTPFDASAKNFTISAWINVSTFQNDATIITKYGASSGVQSYQLGFQGSGGNNTKLVFYEKDGASTVIHNSSTVLTAAQWYHIGLVRNSTQVIFYINGSAETISATNSINDGGSQSIIIGRQDGYSTTSFNGKLDQVRIYDTALSSSDVTNLSNESSVPTANLEAHYKLDGDARDEQQLYDGTATNVSYAYDGTATNVTYQEATNFSPDLIWIKNRDYSSGIGHQIFDSVRGDTTGAGGSLSSNSTAAEYFDGTKGVSSFNSNGFTVDGGTNGQYGVNGAVGGTYGSSYAAWCFNAADTTTTIAANTVGNTIASDVRANQDAGFSIVKYQANSTQGATIGHGLSSAPEMIITKELTGQRVWCVYHKDLSSSAYYLELNTLDAEKNAVNTAYAGVPTSSTYSVGNSSLVNEPSTDSYIAYCFHSVDGFQKVGSYTGNGGSNMIETGFEPAFIMQKRADSTGSWNIIDNERGDDEYLSANLSNAEGSMTDGSFKILSNGFQLNNSFSEWNSNGGTYIYLAIAADPDTTTPTVENSFDVVTYTGNDSTQDIETDFKPDLVWIKRRTSSEPHAIYDSIRGINKQLSSDSAGAEATNSSPYEGFTAFNDNGFTVGNNGGTNRAPNDYVAWCWKAGDHDDNLPQINTEGTIDSVVSVNDEAGFSIVKYTSNGSYTSSDTIGHGLSQKPELVIWKPYESTASDWYVQYEHVDGSVDYLLLNESDSKRDSASTYLFQNNVLVNFAGANGQDTIAYCFTSITGYQKVGSYTGDGNANKEITGLGFSPRFVMIKDSTQGGNWIIHSKPPTTTNPSTTHLRANSSAAEDPGTGEQINFDANGFTVVGTGGNVNTGNDVYIYLAIA